MNLNEFLKNKENKDYCLLFINKFIDTYPNIEEELKNPESHYHLYGKIRNKIAEDVDLDKKELLLLTLMLSFIERKLENDITLSKSILLRVTGLKEAIAESKTLDIL